MAHDHQHSENPLSLKAREHCSRSLKRIFDQINSSGSDHHPLGAHNALDRTVDGGGRFPEQDLVHRPSHSPSSSELAGADVDLKLATGTHQEARNFFSLRSLLELGVGVDEATKSEACKSGYEREAIPASFETIRCASLEHSCKIRRIDSNQSGQERTIDLLKKRAMFSLKASSMQECNQRSVRSSSPELSFQTQESDTSDRSLGTGLFRPQENMEVTTSLARHKSSGASSNVTRRQPTAQLTVFYSGMVHVYDDVPADKGHAIMLLAGSDNSSTPHFMNLPSTEAPLSGAAVSTPTTRELGAHLSAMGFSSATVSSSSFPSKMKQRLVQRSDAELPFARKASLTRFLEKRKDRVQAKAIANTIEKDEMLCASEQSASPKRLCLRPPSPPPPKMRSSSHYLCAQSRPSTPPMTPQRMT